MKTKRAYSDASALFILITIVKRICSIANCSINMLI